LRTWGKNTDAVASLDLDAGLPAHVDFSAVRM